MSRQNGIHHALHGVILALGNLVSMRRQLAAVLVVLLPALLFPAGGADPPGLHDGPWVLPTQRRDEVVARFNRGVSLMERQEAAVAVEEFRRVTEALPLWIPGRINLGIALLNSQKDADLPACEKVLKAVLEDDPVNPNAHYALGMLHLNGSDMERAKAEFEATLRADPGDVYSLYQLGSIARTKGQTEAAQRYFQKALESSPHFSSAYYALSRLAFLAGNPGEGRRFLDRFLELDRAHVGLKPGMKYTEMGRYADVIRNVQFPPGAGPSSPLPSLRAAQPAERGLAPLPGAPVAGSDPLAAAAAELGPRIAAGDMDGDGDEDLFVATASEVTDLFYLNDGNGRFADGTREAGIQGPGCTTTVALGDHDGDGDLDIFAARYKGSSLHRNLGGGRFEDAGPAAGLAVGGFLPGAALFGDADQDGDLDIFVAARDGRDRLYVNLGTGRFEDRAGTAGLGTRPARAHGAFLSDLDGDGDTDIFVAVEGAGNRLFLNDRPLRFREVALEKGASDAGAASAACSADLDGDGLPEIVLARGPSAPSLLLRNRGGGDLRSEELPGATAASTCLAGDFDLDGRRDVFLAGRDGGGARILLGDGRGGLAPGPTCGEGVPATCSSALLTDIDGNGNLDVILCGAGEPPRILEAAPPAAHHALHVELRGIRRGEDCFSSSRGIGARVEVKAGDRWSVVEVGVGAERADAVVRAGLGSRSKADYVRILWPDGLIQSELEIPSGRKIMIEQVQRKASSCPLLFAWDGERFGFVTDFLGGGGLGFLVSPGNYAPPDPTEDVRIPPGKLVPSHGRLLLRLAEPFEEVCYIDRLSLAAVDHPVSVDVYPEERFLSAGEDPTGRLVACEKRCLPIAARDLEGRDVLGLVVEADRRAPRFARDPRFPGYAREHGLELDFGDLRERCGGGDAVFLFLDGWVEYTYSHVVFAAAQAGVELRPPVLEVLEEGKGWKVAVEDMGYPAGMPRTIVVPLPHEAVLAGRIRIRTSMEISWDRVFAAAPCAKENLRVTEAPLTSATLGYLGYPGEYSPDGREPVLYDYERKAAGVAFLGLRGMYTRYGDVKPLLAREDDEFVIFGKGEEVALELDAAALPPLEPGRKRTFVLRARGYCKDRDPHTAEHDTVEPLPFRAMSGYPYPAPERYPDDEGHRKYRDEWNCRSVPDR